MFTSFQCTTAVYVMYTVLCYFISILIYLIFLLFYNFIILLSLLNSVIIANYGLGLGLGYECKSNHKKSNSLKGKKRLHDKAKGQKALLLLERASAAVGKKPPQYVHSHANTSTGKNHYRHTALTDRFFLCTLGFHSLISFVKLIRLIRLVKLCTLGFLSKLQNVCHTSMARKAVIYC